MPRPRRDAKARRSALTDAQWQELAWGLASSRGPGAFLDDRHKRAAWLAHREELIADDGAGSRPAAYWIYDAPLPVRLELERLSAAEVRAREAAEDVPDLYAGDIVQLRHLIASGELQLEEARELVMIAALHGGDDDHIVHRRAALALAYLQGNEGVAGGRRASRSRWKGPADRN
jgi:hypothetical protein